MARQEIGRSSVQRRQTHGLSSNRGVACRAETKAPNSPSKSDRLLAETKCTHEIPASSGLLAMNRESTFAANAQFFIYLHN